MSIIVENLLRFLNTVETLEIYSVLVCFLILMILRFVIK